MASGEQRVASTRRQAVPTFPIRYSPFVRFFAIRHSLACQAHRRACARARPIAAFAIAPILVVDPVVGSRASRPRYQAGDSHSRAARRCGTATSERRGVSPSSGPARGGPSGWRYRSVGLLQRTNLRIRGRVRSPLRAVHVPSAARRAIRGCRSKSGCRHTGGLRVRGAPRGGLARRQTIPAARRRGSDRRGRGRSAASAGR